MIFTSNLTFPLANLCFVSVCVVCVFECVVFVRGSAGARQWTYPIFISLFYCGQDSSLRRAPATHTYARTHTWTHTQMFGCILDHFLMFLFSFLPFFCSRYVSEAPSSLSPYDFNKNTHTQTHSRTHKMLINRQNKRENTHGRAAKKLTPEGIYWNYNDMNGYWEYNEPPSSLMKASREIAFDH